MKTTLSEIRKFRICTYSWEKLLSSLDKTGADDEPLSLLYILDTIGLDATLWCFRAVENEDQKKRLFTIFCTNQIRHLMEDERTTRLLDVMESYVKGEATEEEANAAREAAYDAYIEYGANSRLVAETAAYAAGHAVSFAPNSAYSTFHAVIHAIFTHTAAPDLNIEIAIETELRRLLSEE